MITLREVQEKLRDKSNEDHTSWTPQQFRAFLEEIRRDLQEYEVDQDLEMKAAGEHADYISQRERE